VTSDLQRRGAESMGNLTYRKGSFCSYTSIFCQEGYCSECEIYQRGQSVAKAIGHHGRMRDSRKLKEAGVGNSISV
jgi:hypothetical protein